MSIKPKPLWLDLFTRPWQWVTITPMIYAPAVFFEDKASPIWTPILNHEGIHLLRQNEAGKWKWLWRYATDKQFRLREEAIAIAVEIKTDRPERRSWLIENYAQALSSSDYRHAAESINEARAAILAQL